MFLACSALLLFMHQSQGTVGQDVGCRVRVKEGDRTALILPEIPFQLQQALSFLGAILKTGWSGWGFGLLTWARLHI